MSSSAKEKVEKRFGFEIVDHNIAAGYVTYIVDIWDGKKDDPAVAITRYIGTWSGEQLEKEDGEAFDPDFGSKEIAHYSGRGFSTRPLIWEVLEEIKKADREANNFKSQQDQMLDLDRYYYGDSTARTLYSKFMAAIDALGEDESDEEAWAAISEYRNYQARLHEK